MLDGLTFWNALNLFHVDVFNENNDITDHPSYRTQQLLRCHSYHIRNNLYLNISDEKNMNLNYHILQIQSILHSSRINIQRLFCFFSDSTILLSHYTKKWTFPLRISSVNVTKSAGNYDLVIFTKEILNGKLHFLSSVIYNFHTLCKKQI